MHHGIDHMVGYSPPDMGPGIPPKEMGPGIPTHLDMGSAIPPPPPPNGTRDTHLCYWQLVVITEDLFKLVHLRTHHLFRIHTPSVLTPSAPRNMYGWQAGGTHPTRMLSCSVVGAPFCFSVIR